MADEGLAQKARELGDIDLAALLCLISREHCIISTEAEYLDDLTAELQLVASRTFGLRSVAVDCTPHTTLDELVAAIHLPPPVASSPPSPLRTRASHTHTNTYHPPTPAQPQQQIANVILARNLDSASKVVQIQCLELMRTRRIFTRTAVHACPKQFLLVAVLGSGSAGQARLTKHLNDHFYISHWQDPEDGFPHLDGDDADGMAAGELLQTAGNGGNATRERQRDQNDDDDNDTASQASSASVVRRVPSTPILSNSHSAATNQNNANKTQNRTTSLFSETDLSTLSTLSLQIHTDIEVQRYLLNIVAFLRMHRAVEPGSVPPSATTHFRALVRSLAALHGLDFATPELVQLAARKIYAHHLVIVAPGRERSMQWGSDLGAVKALLEGVQPEDVVEDVLGMVDVPL
ncbi:hypothetical protein F4808DRAFT_425796 [Astrocystis sublimbata]|nr:hypothetical protein F4808DRAFT_425796 [Astrocystis sublimbata]